MKAGEPLRVVEECPWRANVRNVGTPDEVATCRLLGEITGIEDESLFISLRKNCHSCVCKFEPSKDRINALTATLLFHLSNRIIERGGIEDYDVARAQELQSFAKSHLPVLGTRTWAQQARGAESKVPCLYLGEETGVRDCKTCDGSVRQKVFACTHERHDETTMLDCRACLDYETPLDRSKVRTWATCVTTAPRREVTLEESLKSLAAAGWPDAHVFAEPDSPLPEWLEPGRLTIRAKRLGAWPNWFLSLTEMMMRDPNADAYLVCQDDVLYCNGLRDYLEDSLWPASKLGVISLHTASHQDCGGDAGYYQTSHGWSAWGAQAYVFPNASARALVRHHRVVDHRRFGPRNGTRNVDCVVGQWALDADLPYYLHSPSLTQHVGETSTLWESAGTGGRRHAATFIGEGPDIGAYMRGEAEALEETPAITAPGALKLNGGPGDLEVPEQPADTTSLGIVSVLIGRLDCFDRWKEWMLTADIPENTSLYLVDNSADPTFGKILAATALEIMNSRRYRGVTVRLGPGPVRGGSRLGFDRCQNFADALNLVLPDAREDFVLTIDDDTIPPEHAVSKLLGEYQSRLKSGEKIGLVSGICESANSRGRLAIARSKEAWRDIPALGELSETDIIEVGFAGNACCLMSREALAHVLPMRAMGSPGEKGAGPDQVMCRKLRAEGYTLLAHGGVFCDHLF